VIEGSNEEDPLLAGSRGGLASKKRGLSRRTLIWTIIGALAGVAAVLIAILAPNPLPAISVNEGGSNPGGCIIVGNGNCTVPGAASDEEFNNRIRANAIGDPKPPAPYRFTVITSEQGLKVRTSGEPDGQQIGTATRHAVVWADCIQETSYNPDPSVDAGPKWLKIRWPNQTPTLKAFNSERTQTTFGYVHLGWVLPVDHNGKLPPC